MSDHRKVCPREKVPCSYSEVGCEEKMYRNKLEEHDRKNRQIHLNLAMKKVVSLTTTVKELQERVKQLEELQESVEQLKTLIYKAVMKTSFQDTEFEDQSA